MFEQLVTGLGAWSFIVWTIVLVICGAAVLWVVTTVVAQKRTGTPSSSRCASGTTGSTAGVPGSRLSVRPCLRLLLSQSQPARDGTVCARPSAVRQSSTWVQGGFDRPAKWVTAAMTTTMANAKTSGRATCTWRTRAAPASAPRNMAATEMQAPARLGSLATTERTVRADPGDRQRQHGCGQVGDRQPAHTRVLHAHGEAEHDDQARSGRRSRRGASPPGRGSPRRPGGATGYPWPPRGAGPGGGRTGRRFVRRGPIPPRTTPAPRATPQRRNLGLPPPRTPGTPRCPSCWRRTRDPAAGN